MKKSEMNGLVAGLKIQSKKDLAVYTIVGIDLEQGKVILDNGKLYTMGTIQRWYNLYEEEIPEVVEPKITQEELDNITPGDWVIKVSDNSRHQITARVTETQKFGLDGHKVVTFKDIQQNYILDQQENTQGNEIHEDTEQTGQQDVVEGNTATTNTTTPQGTTQQNNLIQSLNNLIDMYGVQLEAKKQYIKVTMEGKRGALCMIRQTRFGALHIDFTSKIMAALDENYRGMLIEQYNCSIYDKTRGYYRIFDCNDTQILETIILTAKRVG